MTSCADGTAEARLARRRLGVCLVFAGALHVAVLALVDVPAHPAPSPRAVLDLRLVTPMAAPVATADETAPQAVQPAVVVNAPALVASAAPQRSAVPPPAPALPPQRPFAGRSAFDLAQAAAAGGVRASSPSSHRVLRLTAAPARPDFAFYLEAWRRQVERVGKLNYPAEARRQKITGALRLLAVIDADGALVEATLMESSGHAVLDEAALRIVRLAAPFAPFPPDIRAAADRLEIERTWRFAGPGGALL